MKKDWCKFFHFASLELLQKNREYDKKGFLCTILGGNDHSSRYTTSGAKVADGEPTRRNCAVHCEVPIASRTITYSLSEWIQYMKQYCPICVRLLLDHEAKKQRKIGARN